MPASRVTLGLMRPSPSVGVLPRNDPRQYDELAGEWWRPDGAFAMLHWLAAARARLVPPATGAGALLVDVGCGAGLLAPHLAGKGYRHVGVDLTRFRAGTGAPTHGVGPGARRRGRVAAGRRPGRRGRRRRDPRARDRPARDGRRAVPGAATGRPAGARHPQRHRGEPSDRRTPGRTDAGRAARHPRPPPVRGPRSSHPPVRPARRTAGGAWSPSLAARRSCAGCAAPRSHRTPGPSCRPVRRPCSTRAGDASRGKHGAGREGASWCKRSTPRAGWRRGWRRGPATTTGRATSRSRTSPTCVTAGLFGLMVPPAAGWRGRGLRRLRAGGVRAGARQRRDRAGLQHARVGDRRAGRGDRGGGGGAGRARRGARRPRPPARRRRQGLLVRRWR